MRERRPRLNPALYIGFQRYFFTFCTAQRQSHFIDAESVECVRDQILQIAGSFDIEETAYCFMPDHVHLLAEGRSETADALAFVHRAKQLSAYAFSRTLGRKLWQPSFFDRILRDDEASLSVARYIFENPVRAGLVENPEDYPFLGSSRYTLKEIMEAICWQP
jgi:putative transposase